MKEDDGKALGLLRDAIESLTEGFALYDNDYRLVIFNERYREMNELIADIIEPGLHYETLLREMARRGTLTDTAENEEEWVARWYRNVLDYEKNDQVTHSNGRTYRVSIHPTELGGFVVTRTDITDQKRGEEEDRQARAVLRDAIESLTEGFALYDDDHRLVMFNERYRAMNGLVADLLEPGLPYEMMLREMARRGGYADAVGREDEWVAERVENAVVYAKGDEVHHSNGKSYQVSIHPTKLGGFVVTRTDITERKQAEAQERDGDLLVRTVLDASSAIVIMARTGDGEILYRSPAAAEMFGNTTSAREHYVNADQRADFVTRMLSDGEIDNYRLDILAKGKLVPASLSARFAEYRGEEVIVTSVVDLTEELALQEELETQRDMLFQNEKMSALGELLAGVAHELNNPLSIVVGHSLMLREEVTDEETLRRIEKISNAAERSAKIVKTFLAMARQKPAKMERVEVESLITTAIDVAGYGQKNDDLEIVSDIPDDLADILADADQITQVIVNLIINASQAIGSSATGSQIKVSAKTGSDKQNVKLKVSDNGPGIPEKIRARIFEPFFTTKEVGDGTGIGLAFCHRIIHSHGGRIWLDNDHSQGSKFCISLPVAERSTGSTEEAVSPAPQAKAKRALVVDDEEDVAELVAEVLYKDGFEVDVAHSGAEALLLLEEQGYDVLLSDLNMPEVDGRGLYEAIGKKHPDLINKLGFITGDTMGDASQALLQESQRPYLEKPAVPVDVRRLVYGILNDAKEAD